MKLPIPHVIILVNVLQAFISNASIEEICDVEGSGMEDCPVDKYCCKVSECNTNDNNKLDLDIDIEYDSESGTKNKRCCDSSERDKIPRPDNCKICIECCEEVERNLSPLPDHCSKCRRCSRSTDIVRGWIFIILIKPLYY